MSKKLPEKTYDIGIKTYNKYDGVLFFLLIVRLLMYVHSEHGLFMYYN